MIKKPFTRACHTAVLLFYLALTLPGMVVASQTGCAYVPEHQQNQLEWFDTCGSLDNSGNFQPDKQTLKNIHFQDNLPACIYLKGSAVYLLNKKGNTLKSYFVDNGCDNFSEGLIRVYVNGKTAFADTDLRVHIQTSFDKAYQFSENLAEVCNGPFTSRKMGEHTLLSGGQCGMINRQGVLVVPAVYAMNSDVFMHYRIQHNSCQAPPVTSQQQALCHGLWHARFNDFFDFDQNVYHYKFTERESVWIIELIPETPDGFERIIEIKKKDAMLSDMHAIRH